MMNDGRFQGQYRVETVRLAGYDYGSNGMYFVTICTQHREMYFGRIVSEGLTGCSLQPTLVGQRAIEGWLAIPDFAPFVELDAFQLMPNHLHGVFWLTKPMAEQGDEHPNQFGPQSRNLASVIRGFKAGVTTFARKNGIPFNWQSSYYDRIIRNEAELNRIRQYVENNPANWSRDQNNPEGILM